MLYKPFLYICLLFTAIILIEFIIYNIFISGIIYIWIMRFWAYLSYIILASASPIINAVCNSTHLYNAVWLSGAAYCAPANYSTMELSGPATGFIYKKSISDSTTDLQGYIGILPSAAAIYVVLRGSSSVLNWVSDFEVRLVPYTTYLTDCNCSVHNGFYKSALGVRDQTIDAVSALLSEYPTYNVIMTGHSYGSSCALLLAMELARADIDSAVYSYGQPRVGDARFAAFMPQIIGEYYRVVHDRDIVPHVPPMLGFGYLHSPIEIFENSSGVLTQCSGSVGEDPVCSAQYRILETDGADHSYYLRHYMACNTSTVSP